MSDPKPTGNFLADCSVDILFAFSLLFSGQTCNSYSQFLITVNFNLRESHLFRFYVFVLFLECFAEKKMEKMVREQRVNL